MSKNPPKPNTSPDHVKETAEAYTCPSHTEARERLEAAYQGYTSTDHIDAKEHYLAEILKWVRTLLATPTQGREPVEPGCGDPDCPLSPEEHAAIDEIAAREMRHAPQQPAPGAPEGWRETFTALADELERAAQGRQLLAEAASKGNGPVAGRVEASLKGKRYAYSHAAQLIRAALASSSAPKLKEE